MINEDWAADVRKYAPDADDAVIAGIVRYCGIALRTRDASLVAFSDAKETARIRDGYCRKKLALTESDAAVDAAIAAVGERMKADRTKNRVTVYYLLAEQFGKLDLFRGKAKAAAAPAVAPKTRATAKAPAPKRATPAKRAAPAKAAPVAAAAAAPLAAVAATPAMAASHVAAAETATSSREASGVGQRAALAAQPGLHSRQPGGGFMFATFLGVVGAIIIAALLAWFISSRMGGDGTTAPPPVAAAPTPAPAPAAPPPPQGAGVVGSEVDGRPMVSVYFDTARADIAPDFATAVAPIKAWMEANPGDRLRVSGFNDPSGDAAFNADLARRRAQSVAAALADVGIAADRIDLERPAETTDASVDAASARRVEITVKPAV